MKSTHVFLFIVAAFVSPYLLLSAFADQAPLSTVETAMATRTCSFAGVTPKTVSMTATSAATSSTLARGTVRVLCTTAGYFYQGAAGATGATSTTGMHYIPAGAPEYIYNPGNNKIGFIRETTSGTCFVSECQ